MCTWTWRARSTNWPIAVLKTTRQTQKTHTVVYSYECVLFFCRLALKKTTFFKLLVHWPIYFVYFEKEREKKETFTVLLDLGKSHITRCHST